MGTACTNEEATVYVNDLDMFIETQLLKDSTVVLSLKILCEESGYPSEWKQGLIILRPEKWEND